MFKQRDTIFISIKGKDNSSDGGSNTFAWNMFRYLKHNEISVTSNILKASHAIIIADKVNLMSLRLAKANGCLILHRIDEEIVSSGSLTPKHKKIIRINTYADVTVFQSEFVRDNMLSYLNTLRWAVIINGADPQVFRFQQQSGTQLGHITNSVGNKKRLDLLNDMIVNYPNESILLVGNHHRSPLGLLEHPNVTAVGHVSKTDIAKFHQRMKCLYFPSERDPCPNTVVEAIISGVPVCYHKNGGTKEIVRNCGLPLEQFDELLSNLALFHDRCKTRKDLYFDSVAGKYLDCLEFRHT